MGAYGLWWPIISEGPSCPWSYGSWISNYLCKQCLSSLMLWVQGEMYNIIWSSLSVTCDRSMVFFTNKTDRHDITDRLLKVVLNTIKQTKQTYHIRMEITESYDVFRTHICQHEITVQSIWIDKMVANMDNINQVLHCINSLCYILIYFAPLFSMHRSGCLEKRSLRNTWVHHRVLVESLDVAYL